MQPRPVTVLREAFDDAWSRISPDVSIRAGAIEAARTKLAESFALVICKAWWR
jgi:hypothetical protein